MAKNLAICFKCQTKCFFTCFETKNEKDFENNIKSIILLLWPQYMLFVGSSVSTFWCLRSLSPHWNRAAFYTCCCCLCSALLYINFTPFTINAPVSSTSQRAMSFILCVSLSQGLRKTQIQTFPQIVFQIILFCVPFCVCVRWIHQEHECHIIKVYSPSFLKICPTQKGKKIER